MAAPMPVMSFGKPMKRNNTTAIATRKVQGWVTKGTQLIDVSWVSPLDGLLRAEEVECNLPDCAPIETLLSFFSESVNRFTKVLKPIAEVSEQEVADAIDDLHLLVNEHLEQVAMQLKEKNNEKEKAKVKEMKKENMTETKKEIKRPLGRRNQRRGETLEDISKVMNGDEVNVMTLAQHAIEREEKAKIVKKEAQDAILKHKSSAQKTFIKGLLGGVGGGLAGGIFALWAVKTLETKGAKRGSLTILANTLAIGSVASLAFYIKRREETKRILREAELKEAARAKEAKLRMEQAMRRRKAAGEFRPRGCPCCTNSAMWPGKY